MISSALHKVNAFRQTNRFCLQKKRRCATVCFEDLYLQRLYKNAR